MMVHIESIRVLGIDNDDLAHDLLTVKQSAKFYGCSREKLCAQESSFGHETKGEGTVIRLLQQVISSNHIISY